MRCIAIIEAQRPGLDSAIVWERDEGQLVAFAYLEGRVTASRPLDADTLNVAIDEVRHNFQITDAQLTRVHDWQDRTAVSERLVATPRRWGG
jgi:hypothetical protein